WAGRDHHGRRLRDGGRLLPRGGHLDEGGRVDGGQRRPAPDDRPGQARLGLQGDGAARGDRVGAGRDRRRDGVHARSMTVLRSPATGRDHRPPYAWAAAAGAAVFLLYALTLARTTAFWDASEYIATAYTMGI